MNKFKIFENKEFGAVRTAIIGEKPYFVGKDVAAILGYAKPLNALATHVDEDDSLKQGLIDSMGRMQETILINESGLYSLILSSKLTNAKAFKRWVTAEVLPTIRRHGAYAKEELLDNPDLFVAVLQRLKEEKNARKLLELENYKQKQIIGELKPKSDYTDIILQSKSLVGINQIAKDYGKSGKEMNNLLHKFKVQYKQGGQWLLYSKFQNFGYTHSETIQIQHANGLAETRMFTKWTQKGRLFIYQLLKSKNILPIIELEESGD